MDALLTDETRALALEFARGAMDHQWMRGLDSDDDEPPLHPVDAERFLDRYVPSPDELPPRCFTKAHPYGNHSDAPEHIWLDSHLRQVPAPEGQHLAGDVLTFSAAADSASSFASDSNSSPPSQERAAQSDHSPCSSPLRGKGLLVASTHSDHS